MPKKNTLFVGKVSLHFPTLGSTNEYALELAAKSRPIEGTVVSTFRQYAGRGQIGSVWESEPDKNLALSLILYPHFLAVRRQFLLNQAVALAVADFLAKYLEFSVKIKWPNDIYIALNKIAGILIQNSLTATQFQYSVAGIGININQTAFPQELPNPTSLRLLTGRDYDLPFLLEDLCHCLEVRYLQLKQGRQAQIAEDYLRHLYRLGESNRFHRPDGSAFTGYIRGVSNTGRLLVDREDGATETFDLKQISYR